MEYNQFLDSKIIRLKDAGFDPEADLSHSLFPFQRDIVKWALRKGRAAIFADCGLGKTLMQLEWAHQICSQDGANDVLILAPLAVAEQTRAEGEKFGIPVKVCREMSDVVSGINITNYEMLHKFDPDFFQGVVLDESSILKNFAGAYRNQIIESFTDTRYKLACTATPSPNDYMELGNHAEFLGAMKRMEMLSMFFIHDSGQTQKWRLKGHAKSDFWGWVCSWAVMIRRPSDLGYDDNGFVLPSHKTNEIVYETDLLPGELIKMNALTLSDRQKARKNTVEGRAKIIADKVNGSDEQWLIWCNLNNESQIVTSMIPDAVEVTGSQSDEVKKRHMADFKEKNIRVLVTKPKIAGLGMNWQQCHNQAFLGLSDSFEEYYQACRRLWRFGQEHDVNTHIVISDREGAVLDNIHRKEKDFEEMFAEMISNTQEISKHEVRGEESKGNDYNTEKVKGNGYTLHLGDCIDVSRSLETESIHYSVFSPPFAELYTYSDSTRDMGNSKNYEEFFDHFAYLVKELYRVLISGRLVSFHCIDIPSMKERDGVIGLKDFPGDLVRCFQREGFIYHSKHVIWKDPLVEATRTKALGLMHKQICKDSSMCRAGLPDYLITMRKPGNNPEPVAHPNGFTRFVGENPPKASGVKQSHLTWQRYASPVWMDINQGNTLNKNNARGEKDEKHICPLQLDVIERAIELWTNPGDLVLDPFMGINSTGYVALQNDRRFVGSELKESYFRESVKNAQNAVKSKKQMDLFSV